jgi:transcriptional regulator of acetoin/glycerol metabolism
VIKASACHEIDDMNIAMQATILRARQERIVTPVGGKPVSVDVRVIAATHRDLKQRVGDGTFRKRSAHVDLHGSVLVVRSVAGTGPPDGTAP